MKGDIHKVNIKVRGTLEDSDVAVEINVWNLIESLDASGRCKVIFKLLAMVRRKCLEKNLSWFDKFAEDIVAAVKAVRMAYDDCWTIHTCGLSEEDAKALGWQTTAEKYSDARAGTRVDKESNRTFVVMDSTDPNNHDYRHLSGCTYNLTDLWEWANDRWGTRPGATVEEIAKDIKHGGWDLFERIEPKAEEEKI